MAIPSGGGTEVLKRTTIHNQSNTNTAFRWDCTMATTGTDTYDVPDHHIITVISIVFNEQGSADGKQFRLVAHDGANPIYLLYKEPISNAGTFVWNDRIVLTAGDKLQFNMEASGAMDAYCSYIDQDWTT